MSQQPQPTDTHVWYEVEYSEKGANDWYATYLSRSHMWDTFEDAQLAIKYHGQPSLDYRILEVKTVKSVMSIWQSKK